MKAMTLIAFSMPTVTDLSSLSDCSVVPVLGIFHGSHEVSMNTVQALFGNIRGLNTTWGNLQFGPGEKWRHGTMEHEIDRRSMKSIAKFAIGSKSIAKFAIGRRQWSMNSSNLNAWEKTMEHEIDRRSMKSIAKFAIGSKSLRNSRLGEDNGA